MSYGIHKKAGGKAAEESRRYLRLVQDVARVQSRSDVIGDFDAKTETPRRVRLEAVRLSEALGFADFGVLNGWMHDHKEELDSDAYRMVWG